MKLKILFLLSSFLFINDSIYIEQKKFSGYIFNEKHIVFMSIEDEKERYTPTNEDIILAEQILKKEISCKSKYLFKQIENDPIINKKLIKYIRQYVGFINKSDDKIIWINFIWKGKFTKEELAKDIIKVNDGGSYYWNVKVNLKTKNLSDLNINGRG